MNAYVSGPQVSQTKSESLTEVERLRREVDMLRGRLDKLNEASLAIIGSLEMETVLQAIIDASCMLTNARYGAILTFDDHGEIETLLTCGISPEQRRRMNYTPRGLGILGYLSEVEGPLRLSDIATHPRSVGFPENHPPMKSFLGISMRREDKHFGNIYLAEKQGGGEFTPEDEKVLAMFACQGAASIANGYIYGMENRARADLEALLDISPIAVMVYDAKTMDLVSLNPEARRIVHDLQVPGRNQNDLLSVMTLRRPNGQDIPLDENPVERAIRSGESVRAEEIVIHLPDGKAIPTLCSAAPIRAEDGEIVSIVSTLQDLTPLEDMERMRAEFLDVVGSELRNPLTTIKGAVATVLNSPPSIDPLYTRQYFDIIDQQVDHMNTLISNISDISRIETGMFPLNATLVDLVALIDEAKSTFLSRGGRNVIKLDIAQPLPQVTADRQRITQLLLNLFQNASRHSSDWSAIIVKASLDEPFVVVSVTDEGAGIDPDFLPHVFRKYTRFGVQRLSRPGTRENLGLAICKGIVEAHGGRIWVESEGLGLGSTFSFSIPAVDERTTPATPDVRSPSSDEQKKTRVQKRVLTVDDDGHAVRLIRGSLLDAGYSPVSTSNPVDAMQLVKAEKPDLVLLSRTRHAAEGIEFIRRILDIHDIPVIILTDHDGDDFLTHGFQAGAEDYIVKPFSPKELIARIKALLSKRAALVQTEIRKQFVLGDLAIDYMEGSVSLGGRLIQLTPTEYKLLREFSINAGTVLSHDYLLRRVWSNDYSTDTQVVRTSVKNLRSKLGDQARSPTYILTVPSVGYRMPRP